MRLLRAFAPPRAAEIAGARPNPIPVVTQAASRNANTLQSSSISSARGICAAASFIRMLLPHTPIPSPATPPQSASKRLSVRNCRIKRKRLAPSAARIAISRPREAVRASSRFATFTHATSSTMPTAPSSTSSESRAGSLTTSFSGLILTTRWAWDGPSIALSSCRAASNAAPFFSRASTESRRRSG